MNLLASVLKRFILIIHILVKIRLDFKVKRIFCNRSAKFTKHYHAKCKNLDFNNYLFQNCLFLLHQMKNKKKNVMKK